jgi:hypothetical protein
LLHSGEGTVVLLWCGQLGFQQATAHISCCFSPLSERVTITQGKMKPISASDVLRKSAPRETLGQTFLHVNRYEQLRESSPTPSLRMRSDSTASQKRKVSDDCYIDELANKPKVSRLDTESAEEIAILDSKISKVSKLCGKMYTVVQ